MARPKYTDYESTAIARIKAAFWLLLEETSFHNITMQRLADRAEVNRNTLYYHYNNLQEVALSAFQDVVSDDISELFMETMLTHPAEILNSWSFTDISRRLKKMHLFAKSESPLLRSILKQNLITHWFDKTGVRTDTLSPENQLQVDYIVNGFIGILGSAAVASNPLILASFPESPIGKAVICTLKQLC